MRPFPPSGMTPNLETGFALNVLSRAVDWLDKFGIEMPSDADAWENPSHDSYVYEVRGAGEIIVKIDTDVDDEGRQKVAIVSVLFARTPRRSSFSEAASRA